MYWLYVHSYYYVTTKKKKQWLQKERSKRSMSMRRLRSDCRVGTAEKKLGLPAGTFRNPNGRDTRSDKKIGTIRKEGSKSKR